jgi:hypothetical protein
VGERRGPHSVKLRRVPVGPTQMYSTWCALLQNIELMPQYQYFGFQPLSRLEAVVQQADEKEGNCNHSAIMF